MPATIEVSDAARWQKLAWKPAAIVAGASPAAALRATSVNSLADGNTGSGPPVSIDISGHAVTDPHSGAANASSRAAASPSHRFSIPTPSKAPAASNTLPAPLAIGQLESPASFVTACSRSLDHGREWGRFDQIPGAALDEGGNRHPPRLTDRRFPTDQRQGLQVAEPAPAQVPTEFDPLATPGGPVRPPPGSVEGDPVRTAIGIGPPIVLAEHRGRVGQVMLNRQYRDTVT